MEAGGGIMLTTIAKFRNHQQPVALDRDDWLATSKFFFLYGMFNKAKCRRVKNID